MPHKNKGTISVETNLVQNIRKQISQEEIKKHAYIRVIDSQLFLNFHSEVTALAEMSSAEKYPVQNCDLSNKDFRFFWTSSTVL